MNKSLIMDVGGILIGAVGSRYIIKAVEKFAPDLSPTIKAIIPVGLGVFMATRKNPILKNAGFGMIGSGGVELANAIVPGIGAPEIPDVFMDGPDDLPLEINGPADQSILSGPADQSILSGPADQSILSAPPSIEEQMYYRLGN